MKRFAIALLLAGCSDTSSRPPAAIAPVAQPAPAAVAATPRAKIDRVSLRRYLEFEWNALNVGRQATTFYEHGFAETGPHFQWLQKIRDKKASLPPGPERMAVGLLEELAMEYHSSRGASTERTRHFTTELMETIGQW